MRVTPEPRANTVLIVDDSPTIRRMVAASLKPLAGFTFEQASNGLEAIERLSIASVGIVILDLNMPDMHGLEVLRFIRSHDRYRNIPAVVLTTKDDVESRSSALEAGASLYMTKPFDPASLLAQVRELLGQ
jgi:two-component system chemotaxis response regulator CheY